MNPARAAVFRKEALAHRARPALGELVLAASPGTARLALVAVAMAMLVLMFGWWGEFTRKVHVEGYLAPDKGLIRVYTPTAGTLVERPVEEGALVKRGTVLAVLSTERSSLETRETRLAAIQLLQGRRASLQREVAAQQDIDVLRVNALVERISNLESELDQLARTAETFRARLAAATQSAARFAQLETQRYVAATQAQQQQDVVLELRGRSEELERERISLEGDLTALRLERASTGLEAQTRRAALERQIAELDQQIMEQESGRNVVITAPADGVVTALLTQPGQQVKAGEPLLSINPVGARMVAKLLVPSRAVGFVAPPQRVALRYEAFPYQRFGHQFGRIESVSKTLVLPGDANLPVQLREPAYLVTVQLDSQTVAAYGKSLSLQAGMSLEGDVHLDRRTLLQWVLDPIYSVMKSV